MNIIILHGDDSKKSYDRLIKFVEVAKKRGWEMLYDDLGVTDSLFGGEKLVVIRNIKLLTKKSLETLSKIQGTLVVYSDKNLPATVLKLFPKSTKIEKFELPKLLFVLLENLYPTNAEKAIKLFYNVLKTEPVELVFFFIARHFRDLYWVKSDSESSGFPSWKISKLKAQVNKFTDNKIELIINGLSEIDIKVKTSKSDLTTELDLLIIEKL